jgi:hypothetical protein
MGLYGNSLMNYMNEAAWKVKEENETDKNIKKDKSFIEKEINKTIKSTIKDFEEKMKKSYSSGSEYDKSYLKDLQDFMKKTPTIGYFTKETSEIEFILQTGGNHDMSLFYQDFLVKELNKNEALKSKGYKFHSEDYIGIYIEKH